MLQLNKKNKLTFKQNLVDDVLDENNPFNNKIKTEDTYIENNLFDDSNSKDIKKVSYSVIKEIHFGDNIQIPSNDEVAIDGPKNGKIIPNPNSILVASNRIIKNIESKDKKEVSKKQIKNLLNGYKRLVF